MRDSVLRLIRSSAALAILASAVADGWPVVAWADAASPWIPGEVIGEPTGAVAHVAITHEDLAFDLRPLAATNLEPQPVHVSATYQLHNEASSTAAPLVFLADRALPGGAAFRVTFDDSPLAATATELRQVPDVWKPPGSTPSLDGRSRLRYDSRPGVAFSFTAVIPAGAHHLSVSYNALPGQWGAYGDNLGTAIWQIGYVLAPARQWASFGDLEVQVQLPSGWRARAIPELTRVGDRMVGQFAGLPQDTLAISAAYPTDPHLMTFEEWMAPQWPLFFLLLLVTAAGAAATPGFTRTRWPFILSGVMWAVPAAGLWMARAYVTPPQGQLVGGKGALILSGCGCLVLPSALLVAVIAAALGVLVVVTSMAVGAAVWARVRRAG